jgi:hypothetical protein
MIYGRSAMVGERIELKSDNSLIEKTLAAGGMQGMWSILMVS